MTYQTIHVETEGPIATLTFSRPQVLNAFDPVLVHETTAALTQLGHDDAVHAIVVTG